jgi:ADP-ribosylglycohydrolase
MQGAILLGAVADAYGYVVEFRSGDQIEADIGNGFGFGRPGSWSYDRIGHVVSDDTQMTLFTAEGCLRAVRSGIPLVQSVPDHCRSAYLAWYGTQARPFRGGDGLAGNRRLYQRRAPGATCLQALARGGWGTAEEPINDSKGCGGIMRVAPIAFLPDIGLEETWKLGCASAALTHGHVLGWSSAGAFAVLVRLVAEGASPVVAAETTIGFVRERPGGDVIGRYIADALAFAGRSVVAMDEIESLGGGWVSEECLSIGLAAALMNADIPTRIATAAHHSGDSDSTASICGQLIGAGCGRAALAEDAFLAERFARLDVASAIDQLVADFSGVI